jgi:shikimate dehydrogenase
LTQDFRLFGLIGYPLGHSFSVPYFTEKFAKEGILAEYRNFPLESIDGFRTILEGEPDLSGLNITVPYKQQVIPFMDDMEETARAVGAVNTVSILRKPGKTGRYGGTEASSGHGGDLWLLGSNTDVTGFMRSLEERRGSGHDRALVLGTGGSSRAVVYVLEKLGIPFTLVSRTGGEGRLAYEALNTDMVATHKLIINTTPVGLYPRVDESPAIPYGGIGPGHLLFDLIYNPAKTGFLRKGEEQGAAVVNGYDMLVYQAEASWEIWNRADSQGI